MMPSLFLFYGDLFFQETAKAELKEWITEYDGGVKNHGEPNTWDVTRVTDMSCLFDGMENFNAPIDQWNTSQVTDMRMPHHLINRLRWTRQR